MFRNGDGRVLRDIACDFLCTFLHDETAEAAEIHVVLVGQRGLDAIHESFDDCLNLHLLTPVLLAISLTISAFVMVI